MLVTFTSKAAADVLMYENHARPILELLHKDLKRGVILAAETASAIAAVEAEIERSKDDVDAHALADAATAEINPSTDEQEDQSLQSVRFSTRAYPFLQMLRAANTAGKDVMWGV